MFNQRLKTKTNSLIVLACSLGIIVVLNVISVKTFFRLDFTEDKIYTLSDASKGLMKELDDPLIIKAYFTKNLPSPYNNNARFLKDQLDEFKAYSKGRLKVEFIDPGEDEALEKELMMMGIPPVQLTNIKSDKFEIKKGFMGLAIIFEDRKEIIPVVKSTVGLEYDIISKIKKIIKKDVKTIGFLTGHGEPDIHKDMETVTDLLREQYRVKSVDIKDGKSMPDDIDTLVIAGPGERISEREKYEIDQFLMKGKTIAFLIDRVNVDLRTFITTPVSNNLDNLLEHYGVKINNDLVLDLNNKRIQIQQRRGFMTINNIINYPLIPIFRDMAKDNIMVNNLEGIFFPFISSIELKGDKDGKLTVESLIRSSRRSWRQTGRFDISPIKRFRFNRSDNGPFTVAATVSGEFTSFYAGKEAPKVEDEKKDDKIVKAVDEKNITIEKSPKTRIVVVADSDFIKEDMLMDKSDIPFIMNMMDWLAQDEALISIRSRGITDRPLEEISDFKRKLIKYINIFGMSIVVVIFGLIRWKARQIKKREVWI